MGESDGTRGIMNPNDVRANAKPLSELIFLERFTIDDVLTTFQTTLISPQSEMRIGGKVRNYNGGFTSRTTLDVVPQDDSLPVRRLTFSGFSSLKAGDIISAQIPRYFEHGAIKEFGPGGLFDHVEGTTFYTDRDYRPDEIAIELNLLDSDGESLRTERSTNYDFFHEN